MITTEAAVARPSPEALFERFVPDVEPRLRRALVAAYGSQRGREATAEALSWAWENWDRVRAMNHPLPAGIEVDGQPPSPVDSVLRRRN
jgi:hypothetical protein